MAATTGAGDTVESQAKKKRAVKILRQITSEFAGTEIAEQAEGFLFDIDYLQVGMKAPEIIGADTDGREIRLSQFAGKVVAIVFWATWCQPCMQMIPHERELMEKHAGKPFTILGINLDNTSADCKETIKKEGISWPIIYDGTPDISKIVRKWHVQAFPTIFVIDHKGVIRHRQVIPFQLGKLVDDLIDKAIQGDG
jgi:peroxiredoxin